ncbi:hypothetical protein KFK09_020361 [Dendrobium nobile]|uniref:Uncharacterized protein n=1 Tax=Dendrobium nobile TaxID=94219 RepID=A0A8T3ATN2_DENNO|nr:hypothetical protein KFK09_020361 [Dendrobium nobile]
MRTRISCRVHRGRRPRHRSFQMGLQYCNVGSELRILIGLHGVNYVGMAVNVMEAMRGKGKGEEGRLMAYVVDMVEMTEKAAATLVRGEGLEAVTVRDEEIVEMREQIGFFRHLKKNLKFTSKYDITLSK